MDLTHSLRARLAAWLVGHAPVRDGMPVLFPAFCDQLVRAGLPIWRASLGLETLHPEASGFMLIWRDGMLTEEEPPRAGVLTSESYLRSPIRVVDETGQPFRRCLAQEGTGGFPLLEELVAEGGTTTLCFPCSSSRRTERPSSPSPPRLQPASPRRRCGRLMRPPVS